MAKRSTTLNNLLENKSYIVRVRAINSLGVRSDWSDSVIVTPGRTTSGTGNTFVDSPSSLSAFAGLETISITWAVPVTKLRFWEVFITDSPDLEDTYSPESETDGTPRARVDGFTFYGISRTNSFSLNSFPSIYVDGDGDADGTWNPLLPDREYYVGVKAVAFDGSKSATTWTNVKTGLLNNKYFQAGTIDADRIRTSNITSTLTITGGTVQTSVGGNGGYVRLSSGGIYAGATPENENSFHVNGVGQVWLGASTYTSAPLKMNVDGSITIRGNGVLNIGDNSGTKENIKLSQPGDLRAQMQFYKGTTFKGAIEYNFQSNEDVMKIGFEENDFSMKTGLRLFGDSPDDSNSHIEFHDNGREVLRLNYLIADDRLEITVPKKIKSGSGTNNVIFDNATNTVRIDTSIRAMKQDIQPLRDSVSLLNELEPVSFIWKDSNNPAYGFIAEQVAEVDRVLAGWDGDKPINVQWNDIIALLVAGFQTAHSAIIDLETQVQDLRERLSDAERNRYQD